MRTKTNWAFAAIAAAGLALAGCGGGGSSSSMVTPSGMAAAPPATTPPEEPTTPPAPTETETAQTEAGMAAEAAKASSEAATASAEAAMEAVANLVTSQTGETARALAAEAEAAAAEAEAAYETAKAEAAKADAATDTTAAVEARIAAEEAAEEAADAADTAEEKSMAALAAADGELMIDGTVFSVGDSSVDTDAALTTVTTGSGASLETTITGLLSEPTTSGAGTNGRTAVDEDIQTATAEYKSPMVNAASRGTVKIGKMLDTSDDMARLLIVTHYAGTKTVEVYDELAGTSTTNLHTRTDSDGTTSLQAADAPAAAADYTGGPVTLKAVGTYYRARAIPDAGTGDITDTVGLQAMGLSDADPPVQQGDMVGATAKGVMVYSYTATDGSTVYVVESSRTVSGGVTTVSYQSVQIHVPVNRDGNAETGLDADEVTAFNAVDGQADAAVGDELVEVTAKIPEQAAYEHVNFGVWASLGEAKANGSQSVTDLGIGFVESIGDGLTGADMPNNGSASYAGNWAATVQEADTDGDGTISATTGAATVSANFTKAEITATLADLATLKGDISGNTFEGDSATATGGGLDTEGDFTGSFSGGFYGAKADETAGIFDFESDGNKAGAFRGAFGGQRQTD